jgi:hypothetical protein
MSESSVLVGISNNMGGRNSLDTRESGKEENDRLGERHRDSRRDAKMRGGCVLAGEA